MPPMGPGGPSNTANGNTPPASSGNTVAFLFVLILVDAYDPLAALMAPPTRVYASNAPSASDDPLAAMMAPPTVRIPGASAAPPSSKAPPVSFKVWTPPVSAPGSGSNNADGQPPPPSS